MLNFQENLSIHHILILEIIICMIFLYERNSWMQTASGTKTKVSSSFLFSYLFEGRPYLKPTTRFFPFEFFVMTTRVAS